MGRFTVKSNFALILSAILLLALTVDLLLGDAFLANDDQLYGLFAAELASGKWPEFVASMPQTDAGRVLSVYQHRLGLLLPSALGLVVFGKSEAVMRMWPLIASLAEILVVAFIGLRVGGPRLGLISAFLLALLPLHVNGTRSILADAPLALALSLGLMFLVRWTEGKDDRNLLLAGVATGFAIWCKGATLILFPVPAIILFFLTRDLKPQFYYWAGVAIAFGLFAALFWYASGRPLLMLESILYREPITPDVKVFGIVPTADTRSTAPFFYFYALGRDLRDTWLFGWFALLGLVAYFSRYRGKTISNEFKIVVGYVVLSMSILSFFPTSLSPYVALPKWENYMLIFIGPMAVISAFFLTRVPFVIGTLLLLAFAIGSTSLIAISHCTHADYMASSREIIEYVRKMPSRDVPIVIEDRTATAMIMSLALGHPIAEGREVIKVRNVTSWVVTTSKLEAYWFVNEHMPNRAIFGQTESLAALSSKPGCMILVTTLSSRADESSADFLLAHAGLRLAHELAAWHIPGGAWYEKTLKLTYFGENLERKPAQVYRVVPSACRG